MHLEATHRMACQSGNSLASVLSPPRARERKWEAGRHTEALLFARPLHRSDLLRDLRRDVRAISICAIVIVLIIRRRTLARAWPYLFCKLKTIHRQIPDRLEKLHKKARQHTTYRLE